MERVARAYAKINLGLRVLGRRADGYHEVDTILQSIDLSDRLTFRPLPQGRLEVHCDDPEVPGGSGNLVWKALHTLRARSGRDDLGMEVAIEKGIPAGSGLGGGSSDAACTLAMASQMWKVPEDHRALGEVAAGIGSDVPFFLQGGTCRARGRGEIIEPLQTVEGVPFGLLIPPVRVQTASVYGRFNLVLTAQPLNASIVPQLILAGVDKELVDLLKNDLEDTALSVFPELRLYRNRLSAIGVPIARMTGSGGAFYFWPVEEGLVHEVESALSGTGSRVHVVRATGKGWEEQDRRRDTPAVRT
jgi:4-diphosphocytidyl-2-C-methyl-D-erythritol kinase